MYKKQLHGCQVAACTARTQLDVKPNLSRPVLTQKMRAKRLDLYTVDCTLYCTVYSILYCAVLYICICVFIYIYFFFLNKLNNLTFCALISPWKRDNQISRFLVLALVKQYMCMHTYEHVCESSSVLGGKAVKNELLCKKFSVSREANYNLSCEEGRRKISKKP